MRNNPDDLSNQVIAKIKKWLTLLTRLLILSAIIIAFAQPFFSKTNAEYLFTMKYL